jgi:hypothetical protein
MDGLSIEGFAIVSSDGMLAGADGLMPNSLKFEVDQDFLDKSLDAATLLIHGRKSHEAQPNSSKRRRLLTTRCVGRFSPTPVEPNVWLWNPAATPFEEVCATLGVDSGIVAVLGGTAVYDMFLLSYAKFHLCRACAVELPGGVPVLSAVDKGYPPEQVFCAAGLELLEQVTLDADKALRHQTWVRAA